MLALLSMSTPTTAGASCPSNRRHPQLAVLVHLKILAPKPVDGLSAAV
jgi:hypothetical protein